MKKTYTKPEIMFEDFSLCTNIAAGCETVIDNPSRDACGYPIEGLPNRFLFIDTVQACTDKINDDKRDGFCYHIPIDDTNNLFNS